MFWIVEDISVKMRKIMIFMFNSSQFDYSETSGYTQYKFFYIYIDISRNCLG